MEDIDLTHELALIEDQVRTDLEILASDPRPLHDRSDWSKGFDAAVFAYAGRLGLVTSKQINDNDWVL